jgi:hypothetical protein
MIPIESLSRRLKGIGLLSIFLLMIFTTGGAMAQEQRSMAQRPIAAPPGSGEIAADYGLLGLGAGQPEQPDQSQRHRLAGAAQ